MRNRSSRSILCGSGGFFNARSVSVSLTQRCRNLDLATKKGDLVCAKPPALKFVFDSEDLIKLQSCQGLERDIVRRHRVEEALYQPST